MPAQTDVLFCCMVCDFRTSTEKILQVHMRSHGLSDENPPDQVYSCVLCQYVNPGRRNILEHMRKKHNTDVRHQEDGEANVHVQDMTVGVLGTVSQIMTPNTSTVSVTASGMSENATEVPVLDEQQQIVAEQDGSSTEVVGTVETVGHLEHIVVHPSAQALDSPGGDGMESLELSKEELLGLNSGDLVQIKERHYLVELTQDPSNPYKQVLSLLSVTTTM